jgi:predicted naringenin-chalcone synthase
LGQLVSQSLFADGFIKYSAERHASGTHFKVLATLEEVIPDSTRAMTWNVSHWGFEIALAKEIPVLIVRALPDFLNCLVEKGGGDLKRVLAHAYFAVHPGGPKILTHVQELLKLRDEQIAHSVAVLKNYGNMSSATLPHIWQALLHDSTVPNGAQIVSFAFGPGLSITGAVMEKICGS